MVNRSQRGSLNLEGMTFQCIRRYASTNHTGTSQGHALRGAFAVFTTLGKMAASDAQAKTIVHPSSSPAKADRQISDGRDSPHPMDTSVIRREAVIRAASAPSGSSTPRGQSPLTLVSATAGSSSRTASPITHLEEA